MYTCLVFLGLIINNRIGILWCRHTGTSYGVQKVTYPITFLSTFTVQITSSLEETLFTDSSSTSSRALSLSHLCEFQPGYIRLQKNGVKLIFAIGKI